MSSYLTRSRPQHAFLRPVPPRRTHTRNGSRLNTILEDGNTPTEEKQSRRRTPPGFGRLFNAQRNHLGDPPLESAEKAPPHYDPDWKFEERGRRGHPRPQEQRNGILARLQARGGLRRLAVVVVLVLVVLALALGLGLGLSKRKKAHDAAAPADPGALAQNIFPPFPLGSWTFDVVLASVTTDCAANPGTWMCFPYTTYAQSKTASRFSFNWVVDTTGSPNDLTIASTPNTFSLDFPSTPLVLADAGTANERYTFSLPLAKQVQPNSDVAGDNTRTVCYFNQTMIAGALYTGGNHTQSRDSSMPQAWPGTVYLEQSSPSGSGVPDCHRVTDGSRVTRGLDPQPLGRECGCVYESSNGTASA